MCIHELGTAAEYDLDIVVVVCNNADYGVISNAPERGERRAERRFDWESPSFATIAEGFGWEGVRVESLSDASAAVRGALDADGPVLVDVAVDPREKTAAEAADYETDVGLELLSDERTAG
jgi:acetolactate synthase-1/2/3 large subunit